MGVQLFLGLVGFLAIGFLWFYVARPILEDFGIIRDAPPPARACDSVNQTPEPTPRPIPVPVQGPDTNQQEPVSAEPIPPDVIPDISGMVRHLAGLTYRDDDGHMQRFSANKIAGIMPGRREEILEIVRQVRGTPPRPEPGPRFEQTGPSSYRRVQGT